MHITFLFQCTLPLEYVELTEYVCVFQSNTVPLVTFCKFFTYMYIVQILHILQILHIGEILHILLICMLAQSMRWGKAKLIRLKTTPFFSRHVHMATTACMNRTNTTACMNRTKSPVSTRTMHSCMDGSGASGGLLILPLWTTNESWSTYVLLALFCSIFVLNILTVTLEPYRQMASSEWQTFYKLEYRQFSLYYEEIIVIFTVFSRYT